MKLVCEDGYFNEKLSNGAMARDEGGGGEGEQQKGDAPCSPKTKLKWVMPLSALKAFDFFAEAGNDMKLALDLAKDAAGVVKLIMAGLAQAIREHSQMVAAAKKASEQLSKRVAAAPRHCRG